MTPMCARPLAPPDPNTNATEQPSNGRSFGDEIVLDSLILTV